MTVSRTTKGILSVVGGVIFHIGLGIANPLGNFNVYLISYINHFNQDAPFKLNYGFFIKTFISFCILCFSPLGGMIDRKIGCHWTMLISSLIQIIFTVLLFFVNDLWNLYIVIVFLGIGMGIGIRAPIKNACFFIPDHKGLICALIFSIGNLSAPLFNYIGETIINPKNQVLDNTEIYFNFAISKNLYSYYYVMISGIAISALLSMAFIFQYKPEEYRVESDSDSDQIEDEDTRSTSFILQNAANRNQSQMRQRYISDMKEILSSWRLWNLFLICFFAYFLPIVVTSTYKVIGTLARFQIMMLKTSISVMGIAKNLISPLWGYCFDKWGYKPLIIGVNIGCIIIGVFMCLSIQNEVFFGILIIMNGMMNTGFRSIFDPLVMKIYTIQYSMEINGVIGVSLGSASIIGACLALLALNFFGNSNNGYYLIFFLSVGFNWISLILSFLENEEPFQFEKDSNQSAKYIEDSDDDEENKRLIVDCDKKI